MRTLKSVIRGALFSFALAGALVGAFGLMQNQQTITDTASNVERVTWHPGGVISEWYIKYTEDRGRNKRYIIDGTCISACTLILATIPEHRVCATEYALLGFHSAAVYDQLGGRHHHDGATRLIWRLYPEKVRELLRAKGWDGDAPNNEHGELILVGGAELNKIVRPCP